MNNLDHVFVELAKSWGIEQIKSKNILNQNGANLVYLHGRDMANKLGIESDYVMPYPSRTEIAIEEPPKKQKSILPWILCTALACGTGGYALSQYLTPDNQPPDKEQGELLYEVE